MDFQNTAQKILQIHTNLHNGFDDTNFMEKLEDFLYLEIQKNMSVTKNHISRIAYFTWQEQFGVTKIKIADTENDPAYYDAKWNEVTDNDDNGPNENTSEKDPFPIEIIIGGEKDTVLYELLTRFDQLRDTVHEAINGYADTKETMPEAQKLIQNGLAEYEAILLQITNNKEITSEIQNLINTYLQKYENEIRENTGEKNSLKQKIPEAKIIKLPPSWKK
jgi:hypothetical protein